MASQKERDNFVYIAKFAECYDETVDAMKKVANLDANLTVEERNLFSVGYKNVVGARRASWRILSSIEKKEEARGNENHVKNIKEYRHKVERELSNICTDIIALIDEHLFPLASAGEAYVFYIGNHLCDVSWILLFSEIPKFTSLFCHRKADYNRYLAEFDVGDDKKEAVDQSLKAYEVPSCIGTHPRHGCYKSC